MLMGAEYASSDLASATGEMTVVVRRNVVKAGMKPGGLRQFLKLLFRHDCSHLW